MYSAFVISVLSLVTLIQGRVLLQDTKCPVLKDGKCFVVIEGDHIFVRQTAEEECEKKFGKQSHLANIYNKDLFKEMVTYVESLKYHKDALILTGMEYYDDLVHYYDGSEFKNAYWGPPPVRPITLKNNRNMCLRVSRKAGKTKMQNIGGESETYIRAVCEYTGK